MDAEEEKGMPRVSVRVQRSASQMLSRPMSRTDSSNVVNRRNKLIQQVSPAESFRRDSRVRNVPASMKRTRSANVQLGRADYFSNPNCASQEFTVKYTDIDAMLE